MKTNITLKHIVSVLAIIALEETLRFIIGKINLEIIDKAFLITIPLCLIGLSVFLLYVYLEKRAEGYREEMLELEEKMSAINLKTRVIVNDIRTQLKTVEDKISIIDKTSYLHN